MAEYVQDSIDRRYAEYRYRPPPDMLDPDTDNEPLYIRPDQLPSPASTPPPSPQIPAPLQIATVHPIPPQSTHDCSCAKRGIYPFSGPGSPPQCGSIMDRIFIHKSDCDQMLYRSATSNVTPDQAVLQEDQISSPPPNDLLSVQPPFPPAAADTPPHKPKSAVRRARQSQPSSIITRSKSSASTLPCELQHSLRQGGQSSRSAGSRAVKRATAFTKSGGK